MKTIWTIALPALVVAPGQSIAGEPIGFESMPLTCEYYAEAAADHVLLDAEGQPYVVLASVPTDFAGYHLFPAIVHRDMKGEWLVSAVPIQTDGWTHVHQSADGEHFVIAMDNIPESPDGGTRFVTSSDGGMTWRYGGEIRKLVYFDLIRYFRMDDTGVGSVAEEYEGGGPNGQPAGSYVFETTDWGRTWTAPRRVEAFDAAGHVDVQDRWTSEDSRRPLREITLDDFAACPGKA